MIKVKPSVGRWWFYPVAKMSLALACFPAGVSVVISAIRYICLCIISSADVPLVGNMSCLKKAFLYDDCLC